MRCEVPTIQVTGSLYWLLRRHSPWMWMDWALALLPLAIAAVLFQRRPHHRLAFWGGFVLFMASLPNAPYVVTDLIHLASDLESGPSGKVIFLLLLPLYGALILTGFESYALCLGLLRRELRWCGWKGRALLAEAMVQAAAVTGVLIGRLYRLNSWDVLKPGRILVALSVVARHPTADVISALLVLPGPYVVQFLNRELVVAGRGLTAFWRRRSSSPVDQSSDDGRVKDLV